MALASSGWDDYPIGRSASPSAGARRPFFSPLVATVALAACLAAAVPVLQTLESFRSAAPELSSPDNADARSAALAAVSRALFERDAENFARDTLQLTPAAVASEMAEAQKLGPFAPAVRGAARGMPLQQRFSLRQAGLPPVASDRAGKEIADTFAALAALPVEPMPRAAIQAEPPVEPMARTAIQAEPSVLASVHVAPSVVMPLASASAPEEAPVVPAPRLERTNENAEAVASIEKPMDQASLPLGRGVPVTNPVASQPGVAIYDISAATVYLPDGERLEAHSGLGSMVDNPRYVDRRNVGPTPPNTYRLARLEKRFFGVEALRLVPVDGSRMYGRDGFLTHTYLLRGRPAQSNGCIVFKDYDRFLSAFKRGMFSQVVVVGSRSGAPVRIASAGG